MHRAEYKPRQLAHATAAGLAVPPTLITNDPHAVVDFAARQPDGIVTKTLYARMPRTEDGRLSGVVYTSDVPPDRHRDPTIATTAHLFQAKLVQKTDLRVTVVGDHGALDFVRTDQGHHFIEINPNGQWGWIEHQTGQPISRTLATALKGTVA